MIGYRGYTSRRAEELTEQDQLDAWFKNKERTQSYTNAYGTKEMNDYTKRIKDNCIVIETKEDLEAVFNLFKKLNMPYHRGAEFTNYECWDYNKTQYLKYCSYTRMFRLQVGNPSTTKLYLTGMLHKLFEDEKVKMTIGDKEFYISKESAESIKEGLK